MLKVTNTSVYTGVIEVNGKRVKTVSQSFDEKGMRSSAMGEFIENKELYYENLKACRVDEDEFTRQMRAIEDKNMEVPNEEVIQ